MKKIAVFGKPGSGKSTLSKHLTLATGIPLHSLDSMLYKKNGEQIDRVEYDKAHADVLASPSWIIDGFDFLGPFNNRLAAADTLIYIDLPFAVSYYLVTKRLLKGFFVTPQGWPEGCSVFQGSMQSYKTLKLCHNFYNDDFLRKIQAISSNKSLYVIRSVAQLNAFIKTYVSV